MKCCRKVGEALAFTSMVREADCTDKVFTTKALLVDEIEALEGFKGSEVLPVASCIFCCLRRCL